MTPYPHDLRLHRTDSADKAWLQERREPINGWRLAFWLLAILVVIAWAI